MMQIPLLPVEEILEKENKNNNNKLIIKEKHLKKSGLLMNKPNEIQPYEGAQYQSLNRQLLIMNINLEKEYKYLK